MGLIAVGEGTKFTKDLVTGSYVHVGGQQRVVTKVCPLDPRNVDGSLYDPSEQRIELRVEKPQMKAFSQSYNC